MIGKNIAAWTEIGPEPAFVSVNEKLDDAGKIESIQVLVRASNSSEVTALTMSCEEWVAFIRQANNFYLKMLEGVVADPLACLTGELR